MLVLYTLSPVHHCFQYQYQYLHHDRSYDMSSCMDLGSLCKAGSSGCECMYLNVPPVGARSTMWQESQIDADLIRGFCWVIDFYFTCISHWYTKIDWLNLTKCFLSNRCIYQIIQDSTGLDFKAASIGSAWQLQSTIFFFLSLFLTLWLSVAKKERKFRTEKNWRF